MSSPELSPLGKKSNYVDQYEPSLLFPIARKVKRDEIGVDETALPFVGCDVWNAYEVSFLNKKGKPVVSTARFVIPCESKNIIESKSFKLYLNSFNNSKFENMQEVENILQKDLSMATESTVSVELYEVDNLSRNKNGRIGKFESDCIDDLDISCDIFEVNPEILVTEGNEIVKESLHSNLLKSNCLVTGQPDWGTVLIEYEGKKINRESLLKYLVSFRNHNEFHEQCVERIFLDLKSRFSPIMLTVDARYTRRGGLDICPFRSTEFSLPKFNERLDRQ